MPPLFLYAIAFLAVLTVVTFVLCHRDDAGSGRRAERGEAAAARVPMAANLAAPAAPLRRSADPAQVPLRPEAPAPLLRLADPLPSLAPFDEQAPASWSGAADQAPRDMLAGQVAELTRRVAELEAEGQTFQEEIRRLRAALGETSPPAHIRSINAVRPVEAMPRLHRIGA